MAASDDDFAFLLAATRRLLGEILPVIESRRKKQSERGAVLAAHVEDTLKAIEGRIAEEEKRYPARNSPGSKRAASRSMRLYARLIWETHGALNWLRRDGELLDLGAAYFADEAALNLLGVGTEVVHVSNATYMYSTMSWPFEWLFENYLKEEMPKGHRPIILTFPAHERHTMLLHCLFVHELGHTVVHSQDLAEKVLERVSETREYMTVLDEAIQIEPSRKKEIRKDTRALAKAWLEELLCDAVAFSYLGPSYLFAFAEMGLSTTWSSVGPRHPSTTLRTKLLVDFAERTGWSHYVRSRVRPIWQWFELAAETQSLAPDLADFADQICRLSSREIFETAETAVGDKRFLPAGWSKQDRHFSELLDNDILPVKRSDELPAEHPEIMLAAWMQAIKRHGNDPVAISKAVGEDKYQRFVAKALEMATLLRVWKERAT